VGTRKSRRAVTTPFTGPLELTLISESAGHRRSGACDGYATFCFADVWSEYANPRVTMGKLKYASRMSIM
jgi:hypothetical protein